MSVRASTGLFTSFSQKSPLTFSNKAAIIRSPALGLLSGERAEYSSFSMLNELNLTLVFVPKIQQPFHKWIFDPLSKKEESAKALPFRLTAGEFWHVLPKATTGWTEGKSASLRSSRQSGAKIYLPPDFHRQAGGKERAKEHTVAYLNVLDAESAPQALSKLLPASERLSKKCECHKPKAGTLQNDLCLTIMFQVYDRWRLHQSIYISRPQNCGLLSLQRLVIFNALIRLICLEITEKIETAENVLTPRVKTETIRMTLTQNSLLEYL